MENGLYTQAERRRVHPREGQPETLDQVSGRTCVWIYDNLDRLEEQQLGEPTISPLRPDETSTSLKSLDIDITGDALHGVANCAPLSNAQTHRRPDKQIAIRQKNLIPAPAPIGA